MLQYILKEKGFKFSNTYTKSASYLFSDGTFLNIDEQKDILKFGRDICHYMLDDYIIKNIISEEEKKKLKEKRHCYKSPHCIAIANEEILKFTDNVVILNGGVYMFYESNYIDLPPKELTTKQYEALTNYLDELSNRPHVKILQVVMRDKVTEFNLRPEEVDNIIKEIKKLYNIEKDI